MHRLPLTGLVRASKDAAVFIRPGLIDEYTVSTDGVRQDFVVPERPRGDGGSLAVDLEVTGARAEAAACGVKLTVTATGRELAYSRLKVTDATGRELEARLDVLSPDLLHIMVQDQGAAYPVRIDPTFSDADWVSMNSGIPGANSTVNALLVDGSGNLYVGGGFTAIGTVLTNFIAKWNGSAWSALGSGMDSVVSALAVSGLDLYAGGSFTTAGGVSASRIAKWNGSAWSALGSGMGMPSTVNALVVSGTDLYAGGDFITAGDKFSPYLARADISPEPIKDWRLLYFGTTANTGNAANLFDFDTDGLVNLLEYALGLNPTVCKPGGLPPVTQEGGYLTMTLTKQPGVTCEVQTAGTLITGQPDSFSAVSTTSLINDATTLKVRDNFLISAPGERFIRAQVTAAP